MELDEALFDGGPDAFFNELSTHCGDAGPVCTLARQILKIPDRLDVKHRLKSVGRLLLFRHASAR